MRFLPPILVAVVAVLLFVLAFAANNEIFAFSSFLVGGVAVGLLISTIRHLLREVEPAPAVDARLREVQERLRLMEERLGMTEDQVERLRVAAEFDAELHRESPRLRSPGG